MRRRKLIAATARLAVLAVLAALTVLALFGAFAMRPPPNQITWVTFGRIREGMSRAEVEAILGPPGNYATGTTAFDGPTQSLSGGLPSRPLDH
jgi:hypothetical protein